MFGTYGRIERKLDTILFYQKLLLRKERRMSVELDLLTQQVADNNNLAASAVALIQGLADQIVANAGNPAALLALAESLKASDTALAAAITANTPAAPPA